MKYSKLFSFALIALFVFITVDAEAQRRSRARKSDGNERSNSRNSDSENLSKIWYGAYFGNLSFFNGNFNFAFKGSAAYKLHDRISGGLTAKSYIDIIGVQNGRDLNLFSYGIAPFTRIKITQEISLQAEYALTSYNDFDFSGQSTRELYTYPLIGGAYESGYGPWQYGINVLFIADEEVRELNVKNSVVEWWFSFVYNF